MSKEIEKTNRPITTVRSGTCQVTGWENAAADGAVRYSVTVRRSYRLPPGQRESARDDGWRISQSLREEDLLGVAAALVEIHRELRERQATKPSGRVTADQDAEGGVA